MTFRGITALRNLVAGGVALIAAWSSYSHMVHLVLRYGERPEVAYALPFSVDGMLLVSTIVMADDKRRGHRVRPLARVSFVIGVAASVAANIAAAPPTLGARIIDAWPALALLLVVEMLARPPAAAAAAEQTSAPRPEHRDVPVRPVPAGNAQVPAARADVPAPKDVPAGHVLSAPELPSALPVPRAFGTTHADGAALHTPSPVPAGPRHERHLQAVPRADDVRPMKPVPMEPVPVANAGPGDPAVLVPPAPPVTVAAEPVVADRAVLVPAEPSTQPRPAQPEPPVPVAAEHADARTRPAPRRPQRAAGNAASGSPRDAAASAGRTGKVRRPATATRALAQSLMLAEPQLTKTEIAQRLDISTRRLRDVLTS